MRILLKRKCGPPKVASGPEDWKNKRQVLVTCLRVKTKPLELLF